MNFDWQRITTIYHFSNIVHTKILESKTYLYTKKMPFDGIEIQPFYQESDNSPETLWIFYPCQVFQKENA